MLSTAQKSGAPKRHRRLHSPQIPDHTNFCASSRNDHAACLCFPDNLCCICVITKSRLTLQACKVKLQRSKRSNEFAAFRAHILCANPLDPTSPQGCGYRTCGNEIPGYVAVHHLLVSCPDITIRSSRRIRCIFEGSARPRMGTGPARASTNLAHRPPDHTLLLFITCS